VPFINVVVWPRVFKSETGPGVSYLSVRTWYRFRTAFNHTLPQ